MREFQEFIHYISRPHFFRFKERWSQKTPVVLAKLLIAKLLLTIVIFVLTALVFDVFGVVELNRKSSLFESLTIKKLLLISVLVPLFEEFVFRYWLIKSWGVLYVFPVFLFVAGWVCSRYFLTDFEAVAFGGLLLSLIFYFFVLRRTLSNSSNPIIVVQRVFPFAFWSSVALFALMHLSNYAEGEMGLWAVLLVLPQLIGGTFYGYICGRYGFLAAFSCHAVWNASLMILGLVVLQLK